MHEPLTREADTSRVCWQTSQLRHSDKSAKAKRCLHHCTREANSYYGWAVKELSRVVSGLWDLSLSSRGPHVIIPYNPHHHGSIIGRAGASPPSRTTCAHCLIYLSVVQIPYSSKCFYVNLFKRHGHKMRPYNAHAYAPSKYFTTHVQLCMCMIAMAAVCLRRTVYFADVCYLGQDRDTVVNYARAYA